jgi:carbonic anhydrase
MHTVHLADEKDNEGKMFAAAMGIMFSVNEPSNRKWSDDQIAVIDKFFDDLQWEQTTKKKKNVKVNEVSYGELMMMVDMDNRWTYRGSVTTPPCAQNVYWNVLRTIYPIKQKHLDQFIDELEIETLHKTGNFREIQPLTKDHDPSIIVSRGGGGGMLFLVLFIVFAVISLVLAVLWMKARN